MIDALSYYQHCANSCVHHFSALHHRSVDRFYQPLSKAPRTDSTPFRLERRSRFVRSAKFCELVSAARHRNTPHARRAPGIVNIPRKEELLALPADAQGRAIEPLTWMMTIISIVLTLLFIQILHATERIANNAWETLPSWPMSVMIPSIFGIILWGHIAVRRRITIETTIQLVMNSPAR